MAGEKKAKMEQLVKKGKWDKIMKHFAEAADPETRRAVAEACALSQDDGSFNCLTTLMRDPDASVQLAAVKSMASVGTMEHATAQLNWMMGRNPSPELKAAITETLAAIRARG